MLRGGEKGKKTHDQLGRNADGKADGRGKQYVGIGEGISLSLYGQGKNDLAKTLGVPSKCICKASERKS